VFRRLLVAVDGSTHAERALHEAIDLAEATKATLTVLVVVPRPSSWLLGSPFGPAIDVPEIEEQVEREYEKLLDTSVAEVPDDVPVTKLLVRGAAAPAIIEQAERGHHDLIVMGSRGRGEVRSLVLGSVSHHVLQGTAVPTLIVHDEQSESEAAPESRQVS